jgi:hypothetical protein
MKEDLTTTQDSMDGVFVESADIDIADGDNYVFLKKVLPDILFVNDIGTSQNGAVNIVLKRRDFSNQTLSTDSTTQITSSSTFGSSQIQRQTVCFAV